MTILQAKILGSIKAMRSVIPFFPADKVATTVLARVLERLVKSPEELEWLTSAAIMSMTKWEGVPELRALYCTRYKPTDGLPEVDCHLPGFTRGDLERQVIESTPNQIEGWKGELKKLPAAESADSPRTDTPVDIADQTAIRLLRNLDAYREKHREQDTQQRLKATIGIHSSRRPLRELEQELAQVKRPVDAEELARRAAELEREVKSRIA